MSKLDRKLNILIVNDDGIGASGVSAIHKILNEIANLYVVCPESQRSGASGSVTVEGSVTINKTMINGYSENVYTCSGTPADCVMVAFSALNMSNIDLVISGINVGPNYGQTSRYSGTVGAAIKARVMGCPAIAISYEGRENVPFDVVEFSKQDIFNLIFDYLKSDIKDHSILNINMPKDKSKGVKFTMLSDCIFSSPVRKIEFTDNRYYIGVGNNIDEFISNKSIKGDDFSEVKNGFIAVSKMNILDREIIKEENFFNLVNSEVKKL